MVLLVAFGAAASLVPFVAPGIGFQFMWVGLFLFLDPLNYITGRPSIIQKVSAGRKSIIVQLFAAGLVMGLFWEFWNYQAYPRWTYAIPYFANTAKLFEMPFPGYLGYLPFAFEVFLFYAFFRHMLFKGKNTLLFM